MNQHIVCNDFLPPSLISTPPAWGTPQLFSIFNPPSYWCKFLCLIMRKINNLAADFFALFVRKIDYLIDCIWFYYRKNYKFKEGFKLLLTSVYMNQNFIDHNDMCSTPPGKILPPQLGVPPQLFWDFFYPPSLANFRKVLPPS